MQILRLDGKMHPAERESTITRFNSNSESWVLCASVKACSEGIFLVGASRVVLLEVSWNPVVGQQAISRAFRIGQQRKVVVYLDHIILRAFVKIDLICIVESRC